MTLQKVHAKLDRINLIPAGSDFAPVLWAHHTAVAEVKKLLPILYHNALDPHNVLGGYDGEVTLEFQPRQDSPAGMLLDWTERGWVELDVYKDGSAALTICQGGELTTYDYTLDALKHMIASINSSTKGEEAAGH